MPEDKDDAMQGAVICFIIGVVIVCCAVGSHFAPWIGWIVFGSVCICLSAWYLYLEAKDGD